jgi:hypothetical protein
MYVFKCIQIANKLGNIKKIFAPRHSLSPNAVERLDKTQHNFTVLDEL